MRTKTKKTSWEPVAKWYGQYMGVGGGAFQRDIIFPGALRLLAPKNDGAYLDIACGQGAFSHLLAKQAGQVFGFDASPALVKQAKLHAAKNETFTVGDARNFAGLFFPRDF